MTHYKYLMNISKPKKKLQDVTEHNMTNSQIKNYIALSDIRMQPNAEGRKRVDVT